MSLTGALASVSRIERKGMGTPSVEEDKLLLFGVTPAGDAVVAKTMYDDKNEDGPSPLEYEALVYKNVVNPMMERRESANLVTSVAWIPDMDIDNYESQLLDISEGVDDYDLGEFLQAEDSTHSTVSTLVTRVPTNFVASLSKVIERYMEDWRVPFQMAYTLTACEYARLSHNDNHLMNWLVSEPAPAVYYALNATQLVSVSGMRLWLYDWDMAYAADVGVNPVLDGSLCTEHGMCNSVSGLHDLAQMACSLLIARSPDTDEVCDLESTRSNIWPQLQATVCIAKQKGSMHPCHLPLEDIRMPPGASTALDFVVQQGGIPVTDVRDLTPDVAKSLQDGTTLLVAHARIDKAALQRNLSRVAASRKRQIDKATPQRKRQREDLLSVPVEDPIEVYLNIPWQQ